MNSSNFSESFQKTCKKLLLTQPFYGLFLMMMNKQTDKRIPTLGIGRNKVMYELLVNPDFWVNLRTEYQLGALQHEVLHIIEFHLTDFQHLTNNEIANMAMDCHINQFIPEENREKSWLLPSSFPELKLEWGKGTNYYYEKLLQAAQSNPTVQMCIQACQNNESSVLTGDGKSITIPQHDWPEGDNSAEASNKIMQQQVRNMVKEVAEQIKKSRGTVPNHVQETLDRIEEVEPPKFDWKGYIRRFIGNSIQVYTKRSRRKFNFRFPSNPGMKIKQHKHILLAIDTSGSVNTEELIEFQKEMYHIQKTGTEITVIQCDSAVSHIGKFDYRKPFEVHGRGGTDFQPVIDYFNEHINKFCALIFFTDGEASNPDNVKGNVLWVLSSDSEETDHLTGRTIKLEL